MLHPDEPVWPPGDTRWDVAEADYDWRPFRLKFTGRCIYCGEDIPAGRSELYSRRLKSVGHVECEGGVRFNKGNVTLKRVPFSFDLPKSKV